MLEVCIDSLESAANAIRGGADELEVCSSLNEGGLTPSAGLVKQVLFMVNNLANSDQKPKVNVMIRCRAGSDFCYTKQEMVTMLTDIEIFKTLSVNRLVFGALTITQEVDEENCSKVIAQARPLPVTFHRAFDLCKSPSEALNIVISLGFNRLLTSGQRPSAGDHEAIDLIRSLQSRYGDKIEIMPGSGINHANAKIFIDMGCKIVHSSCKRARKLPIVDNDVASGMGSNDYINVTDENIVKEVKSVIS